MLHTVIISNNINTCLRFRLLWKHSVHLHVSNVTIVSVLSQALYNRLVPSVNGVRRFSPIQISRLRVSRSTTAKICCSDSRKKRTFIHKGTSMSFDGKVAFSPWKKWVNQIFIKLYMLIKLLVKWAFLTWLSWCPYFKAAWKYRIQRYWKTHTFLHRCYHHEIALNCYIMKP